MVSYPAPYPDGPGQVALFSFYHGDDIKMYAGKVEADEQGRPKAQAHSFGYCQTGEDTWLAFVTGARPEELLYSQRCASAQECEEKLRYYIWRLQWEESLTACAKEALAKLPS